MTQISLSNGGYGRQSLDDPCYIDNIGIPYHAGVHFELIAKGEHSQESA